MDLLSTSVAVRFSKNIVKYIQHCYQDYKFTAVLYILVLLSVLFYCLLNIE